MNYNQLKLLYKKEILDVIRDKKTILTMVVLPLILYPLIFFVGMQVVTMIINTQQEKDYQIAYANVSDENRQMLNDWIAGDEDELDYHILEVESDNPEKDLASEIIDAYITSTQQGNQLVYKVHYLSAVTDSSAVSDMLEKEIQRLTVHNSENKVKEAGLDVEAVLHPIKSEIKDESSNESAIGSILGGIIPFLMITSILMGAMYPAIDATAGEKERGTLETLLTLPINSVELIMSKFLSVATIAMVSVLINVISMGGIAAYMYTTITALASNSNEFHLGSFIPAILITLLCVMAFALFMSAVVMCICAFAKSFKEANNYITPLTLIVVLAGYVGMIPNLNLSNITALIPVANICLLVKDLLVFKYDFALISVVLLSNVCYAFVSVRILAAIYNSESILFGESMSGVQLFESRKNIKEGSLPSVVEAVLVLVVAQLLMVYVGGIVAVKDPKLGVVVPQLFIGLLPIAACLYIKGKPQIVFRLKLPTIRHWLSSIVLFLGVSSLSMLVSSVLSNLMPSSSESLNAEYLQILDGLPFWAGLLLIALTPAVCEEIMFRGYLFTAFSKRFGAQKAIVLVAFIFGICHMSLIKLIPTMILGIGLAYAAHKSESLVASSTMHFLNNGFAVFVLYYGDKVPFLQEEKMGTTMVVALIAVAVVGSLLGVLGLQGSRKE